MVWCLRNLVSDSSRHLTWPTFLSGWSICHTSDHIGHRVLTRRPGLFCPVAWKTRTSCRSLVAARLPSSEDSMKMWGIFSRIYWDLHKNRWRFPNMVPPNHPLSKPSSVFGVPHWVGNHHIWIHHFLSRSKAGAKMLCDMAQIPARDGVVTRGLVGGFNRLEKY